MSTLRLSGAASGFSELSAPAVAGDQLFTLPGTGGNLITDGSDLTAQVKTATNASGSAPIYSCRAWVNFDGTGTPAIRASGNVSSITDIGTGNYTVNFTTAMADADYSVCGIIDVSSTVALGAVDIYPSSTPTTSSVQIKTAQVAASSFVARNPNYVYVAIFR